MIQVMSVGPAVKVMSGGILNPILITSILEDVSTRGMMKARDLQILLLIVHEGGNGPTLIGMGPSLSTKADYGTANAEVIDGTGNGAERRRHLIGVGNVGDNRRS